MKDCKEKDCSECPIETIEQEIKDCHFQCMGGHLEHHRGYMALLARAKARDKTIVEQEKENEQLLNTCIAAGFIGEGTQIIGDKRYKELVAAEREYKLFSVAFVDNEEKILKLKKIIAEQAAQIKRLKEAITKSRLKHLCPCGGVFTGVGTYQESYVFNCTKCGVQITVSKQAVKENDGKIKKALKEG